MATRQASPLRRTQTEANLTGQRQRAASPPPQAPNNGRPRSPRDKPAARFRGGEAGSSSDAPASPGTSPRHGGGRGVTAVAAAAIAAYEEGGPVFSSSASDVPPPPLSKQESASRESGGSGGGSGSGHVKGGGGSNRHAGGDGSGRLEKEHKELVRAFGEKCEQLRAAHASLTGVELRLAQMEACGASELMRQRLEAAESAAHAESARQMAREAELTRRIEMLEGENLSLRRELGRPVVVRSPSSVSPSLSPSHSPVKPAPLDSAYVHAPPQMAAVHSAGRSISTTAHPGGSGGAAAVQAPAQRLYQPPLDASIAAAEEAEDDDDDDDGEADDSEEEDDDEEEGEEDDEEEDEEEEMTVTLPPSALAVSSSVSSPSTTRSESLNSDSSAAEATGSSPRPEPLHVVAGAAGRGDAGAARLLEGDAKGRLAGMEAKLNTQLEAKLFQKLHSGQHVPELGLGRDRDPSSQLSQLSRGGSSAHSTGRSAGSGGGGLDFLDRLARAESQPGTPTSQA